MYIIEGRDIAVKAGGRSILEVEKVGIPEGGVFAVIGPNGSGKSTLLRVLALLQAPQDGYVSFRGKRVEARDRIKIRRKMAVVFQEPLLLDATVKENVTAGLRIRGMDSLSAGKKADFWMQRFKVDHLAGMWAKALSGGEAQRVSLARALALEPEVLFLDEPFANLDAPTRENLLLELSEVLRSTGTAAFFVSHDFREVAFLADRAMAIMEGRPVQEGDARQIIERPATQELARFVGMENIWDGRILEDRGDYFLVELTGKRITVKKEALPENLKLSTGQKVKIAIRSEKINLSPPGVPDMHKEFTEGFTSHGNESIINCWKGFITSMFSFGNAFKITVDCGITVNASVPSQLSGGLKTGDLVEVAFLADAPCILVK
ncbi:ABC transporter ATP-binding protein [Thermoanaerobacterium sp. DL9XJH110]|uniref:ABC transporter ATP-binding protein n=1 Tax=Thermoanaerobacterium sp. DL9XJH110 TaxID=3386643 RepID=UPI003BB68FFD